MIRGILFDATGTLIDLRESVGETYAKIASAYGVSISPPIIEDAFYRILPQLGVSVGSGETIQQRKQAERKAWYEVVRSTFRAADSTAHFSDFEEFFDQLYAFYGRGEAWILRPGVVVCLERLQEDGVRTGVLSNFDHRLPAILEDLGIAKFFTCITTPFHSGERKPAPEAFRAGLREINLKADQTLYVGNDPEIDQEGARACQLEVLLVDELSSLAELPTRLATPATLGCQSTSSA